MNQNPYAQLPGVLLPWYHENKRPLPWRQTRDPYPIWVSEIMLQQTRVEAVKGYFSRFIQALPSIEAVAQADDTLLHKLWEGLGYYSRVQNMKKAAQIIVQTYGGHFPNTYRQILDLPGIGPYTAGAICSIAFDLPTPAVDGNVLRVAARLTNDFSPIDRPAFQAAVHDALAQVYPRDAGSFTQALMELGATLCGPNRPPACGECPCRSFCLGHLHQTAQELPVKSPKRPRKPEALTVFILQCNGSVALEKRPARGLLAGLWAFPNIPGTLEPGEALQHLSQIGLRPRELLRQSDKKHIFTHVQWNMRGYYVEVEQMTDRFCWFTPQQIHSQVALPTAFRQFWTQ